MHLVIIVVLAGALGTLAMDALNYIFARLGILTQIDVTIIGRMAAGWMRGCFNYRHPSEMRKVSNERFYGYITHYSIGVGLAVPYVFCWELFIGGPPSPGWALAYGVLTTVASYFLVYPSMGFGALGRRSPEGIRAPLSSLANHLFYGAGMAAGIVLF